MHCITMHCELVSTLAIFQWPKCIGLMWFVIKVLKFSYHFSGVNKTCSSELWWGGSKTIELENSNNTIVLYVCTVFKCMYPLTTRPPVA